MNPLTQAIGWALLHLLWQATAVALVLVLLLSRMARRSANARYVAACGALGLILAVFLVTALRSYAPLAAATAPAQDAVSAAAQPTPDDVLSGPPRAALAAWSTWTERALPSIVALWLAGVLLLWSRLVVSWWRARRLVGAGVPPAVPDWERLTTRLCEALGIRHAVRLLESAAVEIPAVVGSLRPVILLPVSALSGLTTEQVEMVLAHELAHVRRHDFLLNLLQTVVETLLFFHPAVWWISRRVRVEREHCCDDLAVAVCGDPGRYARALARLEELRAEPIPLAVAADGGSLLERVRRLAGQGRDERSGSAHWLAALGVLTLLLLAVAVPSIPVQAQREAAPPAPPAEENLPAPVVDVAVNVATAEEPDEREPEEPAREGRVRPTVDELIALRAGGVTPDYLASMRALFPKVSLQEASNLGVIGVTPDYVRAMRGLGFQVFAPDTATSLRAVGVTEEYVRQMRAAGLTLQRADEATSLRAVGVTPEYLETMRALGFSLDSGGEVSSLRAVGVTPEFVGEMRDAGFAVKTAEEAASLLATGVTADWVRDMRAAGIRLRSAPDASSLRALGVTPELVLRLREAGYRDLSISELKRLAAFGVDEFLRDLERYRTEKGDVQ